MERFGLPEVVGGRVNWLSNFGNCVWAPSQTTDECITQHAHCWPEAEGAEHRCSLTDMSESARTTVSAAQSLRTSAVSRRLGTHPKRGCYIVTGTQWQPWKQESKLLLQATAWMDLTDITLKKSSQTHSNILYNTTFMMFRNRQSFRRLALSIKAS